MQYPINPDKYIAAMRLLYGANLDVEEAHRKIIPIVNECYAAGLRGEGGFPIDADAEIRAYAEGRDHPLSLVMANKLMPPMVKWFNRAYEQGRRDAEEGGEIP